MKFILAIVCLVGCASCVEDFPSIIQRCKYDDEPCILKEWNRLLRVAYTSGVPELDLPLQDSHFVDKEAFSIGSNLITLTMSLNNFTVHGIGQTVVTGVKGLTKDVKQMESMRIFGFNREISIVGTYDGSGKMLLLQVSGRGRGEIHVYNSTYEIIVVPKVVTVDGEDYLELGKVSIKFKSEKFRFRFDNILNNKEISDSVNRVMNENEELFAVEAYKPLAKSFSKIFRAAVAPIFRKYPYRSFFLE